MAHHLGQRGERRRGPETLGVRRERSNRLQDIVADAFLAPRVRLDHLPVESVATSFEAVVGVDEVDRARRRLGSFGEVVSRKHLHVGRQLRGALDRGRGVIVLTAHIGNWEVGTHHLTQFGVPVNLVMQANRMSAAERWIMRRRESAGVRIIRIGTSPSAMLAMREALRRGEIVAAQGDRAPSDRSLNVTLFGGGFRVPIGPFLLARLNETPLVPAFVIQDGWWRWCSRIGDPIWVATSGDQTAALVDAASRYAEVLEQTIRRHPDQWLNFYDVWGDPTGGA